MLPTISARRTSPFSRYAWAERFAERSSRSGWSSLRNQHRVSRQTTPTPGTAGRAWNQMVRGAARLLTCDVSSSETRPADAASSRECVRRVMGEDIPGSHREGAFTSQGSQAKSVRVSSGDPLQNSRLGNPGSPAGPPPMAKPLGGDRKRKDKRKILKKCGVLPCWLNSAGKGFGRKHFA